MDDPSETSSTLTVDTIELPARACNFAVHDPNTGEEVSFAFIDATLRPDLTDPGYISNLDQVIFFEPTAEGRLLTWKVAFVGDDSLSHTPVAGDELNFAVLKPFSATDVFVFEVEPQTVNNDELNASVLDDIIVVPNPYIASASWESKNPFSDGRGPRELHFVNLPEECTIRIYTVGGHLVDALEHNSLTGTAVWDMLTKDNLDIAYGVYIFHVDAPGIGEKIGKFAVIK